MPSKKHDEFRRASNKLFFDLLDRRAFGVCELLSRGCKHNWNLAPHHIIKRNDPKNCKNEAWNILVLCPVCHYRADHPFSSINGLPKFTIEEQFEMAKKLNGRYGIEEVSDNIC